jgi:hypothetical protein
MKTYSYCLTLQWSNGAGTTARTVRGTANVPAGMSHNALREQLITEAAAAMGIPGSHVVLCFTLDPDEL